MKEKDVQSMFTKWVRSESNTILKTSFTVELKLVKSPSKSLPFSAFQPQQLPMLHKAKHGCVYKKLSDADPSLKPFDAFQICSAQSFVGVIFYKPNEAKHLHLIDIDSFLYFKKTASRKSITELQCQDLATHTIIL